MATTFRPSRAMKIHKEDYSGYPKCNTTVMLASGSVKARWDKVTCKNCLKMKRK